MEQTMCFADFFRSFLSNKNEFKRWSTILCAKCNCNFLRDNLLFSLWKILLNFADRDYLNSSTNTKVN